MAVKIEVRNPDDKTTTYDQIEIQRNTTNSESGMANLTTSLPIDLTLASDLSTGYSSYTDIDGVIGTHYYRYRYKDSVSGGVSAWSDIFPAGGSVLQSRFRRMMHDTNSNKYFFEQEDLDDYESQAILSLWPITWFETYDDEMIAPDGTTEIFPFAIGVTRVSGIDILDSNGNNLGRKLNYHIRNRYVIFDEAPNSNITVRCWVEKMFLKLSEIPSVWDSHLLNQMRLRAYETLEADRARYYKYSTAVQSEGSSLPALNMIITRLEGQIAKREGQLRRVRKPAFIKLV